MSTHLFSRKWQSQGCTKDKRADENNYEYVIWPIKLRLRYCGILRRRKWIERIHATKLGTIPKGSLIVIGCHGNCLQNDNRLFIN